MNYAPALIFAADDQMVIPQADVNTLLDYLAENYPLPQYADIDGWKKYYSSLMPLYISAILDKKYKPYIPQKSDALIKYMNATAQTRLGIATAFMMSLYNLANTGAIQTYTWNPAIYKTVDENKPVSWFEKAFSSAGTAIGGEASKTFNKVLFTGAIVAVIYLLGKGIIAKKLV